MDTVQRHLHGTSTSESSLRGVMTGISHLPDEILSHIFDQPDVPNESLFNLSLASKRLHLLVLPLFLARYEITDPAKAVSVHFLGATPIGAVDAFSGLSAALYVDHIEDLSIRFGKTDLDDEIDTIMHHFRRVVEYLRRFTSVDKITLGFDNNNCGCCIGLADGETLDETLEKWSEVSGLLLNTILKTKCRELTIQNGRYMAHAYSFKAGKEEEKLPKGRLKVIKNFFGRKEKQGGPDIADAVEDGVNVLRGDGWVFRRAKGTGEAFLVTPFDMDARTTGLQSLTIQSVMLVFPPMLHWGISLMKYTSLQSLTVKCLAINRRCWPSIFNLIIDAIPHLPELRLQRLRSVSPPDLVHFLSRFTKLTSLYIGRDVDHYDSYDMPNLPDFPWLVSLYAPAGWVFKLLSTQRSGLARLEKLSIVYQFRNDGFSHWLRRSVTPSIPILLEEQRRPSLTLALEVYLGTTPGWRMSEDVNHPNNRDRPEVDIVTSLTLIVDQELKKGDLALSSVLPGWLSLFIGLRHLSIKTYPKAMGDEAALALVHRIIKLGALAAVSNVEVNGKELDMDGPDGEIAWEEAVGYDRYNQDMYEEESQPVEQESH